MNRSLITLAVGFFIAVIITTADKTARASFSQKNETPNPKIQVAILLDVSNSMDGLINQAKNQLWHMVNILGKVSCNQKPPRIEVALYEYGRPANDLKNGYVKQIDSFTNDLNKFFQDLVALNTNGGDEFCGHVMYNSLTELNWDSSASSYKVIFIAGNESFLQGDISFTTACEQAKKKGVVINTIYCGDLQKGISENWNLGAECGNGSFINIDQNGKQFSKPSPYDDSLLIMKQFLTDSYIPFGKEGQEYYRSMLQADSQAVYNLVDPTKIDEFVVAQSNINLVSNPNWELIDAMRKDSTILDTLDLKTLPDSLKNKSRKQIKQVVIRNSIYRTQIQQKILELKKKQEDYIASEKARAGIKDPETLESAIEKIITDQVKRYNMRID
jgi:hypothetical protein